MTDAAADHPHVIAWPPLIFGVHAVLGTLAHGWWPVALLPAWHARLAGALLVIASGCLAIWAKRAMEHAGTNIKPSQPTTAIVVAGPYQHTRNPMYLSLCLLHLGIALLLNGALATAFLIPLVLTLHFGVIRREERYLAGKFGEPYLAYQRRVRRWF
jgi:protein-S-isoprenylcysteine O-methyltransferase Ste14